MECTITEPETSYDPPTVSTPVFKKRKRDFSYQQYIDEKRNIKLEMRRLKCKLIQAKIKYYESMTKQESNNKSSVFMVYEIEIKHIFYIYKLHFYYNSENPSQKILKSKKIETLQYGESTAKPFKCALRESLQNQPLLHSTVPTSATSQLQYKIICDNVLFILRKIESVL